jgi:hypothetical protein
MHRAGRAGVGDVAVTYAAHSSKENPFAWALPIFCKKINAQINCFVLTLFEQIVSPRFRPYQIRHIYLFST